MMNQLKFIIPFILLISIYSCKDDDLSGMFYGEEVAVGNGNVRLFMSLDADGAPTSIGVEFTSEALQDLPTFDDEYILPLPSISNETAFQVVGLNWNVHGHPPEDIYDSAHFDLHFYTISQAERNSITLNTMEQIAIAEIAPASDFLAADYMMAPGSALPGMGSHWFDVFSGEFNGQAFDQTMLYGYNNGSMTFVEPMFTLDYISTPKTFSSDIKVPSQFERTGYYPSSYSIVVNTDNSVVVTMSSMMAR